MKTTANTTTATQSKVCNSLLGKQAYPHKVSTIQTEDTHISWIFLAGPHAYKIKKQVKFGEVLDFSTLSLRRQYCYKEVELNRKLCKDMYLGVVRIIAVPNKNDNRVVIADSHTRIGKVIEYAVKMKHIAPEYRMDKLLAAHRIKLENIAKIASILNQFHSRTSTNREIQSYGKPRSLKYKIKENFQTLARLRCQLPHAEDKLIRFINNNENIFLTRIRDKKIRDIHGDLYLKNVFIVKDRKYYLYDRIEFNDALRYADVAEDVAHLSMDLEYHKHRNLKLYFVRTYVSKSRDHDLVKILDYLICYKAFMRAKVSLFQASFEATKNRQYRLKKDADLLLAFGQEYLKNLE